MFTCLKHRDQVLHEHAKPEAQFLLIISYTLPSSWPISSENDSIWKCLAQKTTLSYRWKAFQNWTVQNKMEWKNLLKKIKWSGKRERGYSSNIHTIEQSIAFAMILSVLSLATGEKWSYHLPESKMNVKRLQHLVKRKETTACKIATSLQHSSPKFFNGNEQLQQPCYPWYRGMNKY